MVCAVPLRICWAGGGNSAAAVSAIELYPKALRQEACLECHDKTELKSVSNRGDELTIHTSKHQFERSVHGRVECVTCHAPNATVADFEDTPHKLDYEALPACMNCHDKTFHYVQEQLEQSWHFETKGAEITCTDCHNPHTQQPVTAMDSYVASVADSNKICMDCHTSAIRYKELTGKEVYTQDLSHEFLPNRDQHFSSIKCVDCHTPIEGDAQGHLIRPKEEALRDCEACHTEEDSFLVGRIKTHSNKQQGGGSFVGKGFFDDAALIDKMEKVGISLDRATSIVTRIVPEDEIMRTFADDYVPGTGQVHAWDYWVNRLLLLVFSVVAIHGLLRFSFAHKPEGKDHRGNKIYPNAVRVLHAFNGLLFLLLFASGWSIHAPDALLSLPMALSVDVHDVAGVLLTANFMLFLLYSLLSGDIAQYLPIKSRNKGLQGIWQQTHYYLIGIFRGDKKPHHASAEQRLNPIQQLTYLVVYCLGMFIMLASGLLLLIPALASMLLPDVVTRVLANAHYLLAVGYLLFLIVHLYMITTGKHPLSLLKGMVTGHHYD